MKIAVIGSGISGLGAAYILSQQHEITLYEKNDYIGGHSRTIEVQSDGKKVPVDTGFIVFNERNYPHLTALFKHLEVPVVKSSMSFGVSINEGWLEYSSAGLFGQKRNLLRPQFWRMLADILRFNRTAARYIDTPDTYSMAQALQDMRLGDWFRRYYLQAMGAAIWSCSVQTILRYPAKSFLRFFQNHGLLTVNDQPQWHSVLGGSREYIKRIISAMGSKLSLRLDCAVTAVEARDGGVYVTDVTGQQAFYDKVIMAGHADHSLALLTTPTAEQRAVLQAFTFQPNSVVVHSDTALMPKQRKCWASWIYLSSQQQDKSESVSLSYWMNNLQQLDTTAPVLVTLNAQHTPAQQLVQDTHQFDHPVFTAQTLAAQQKLPDIQGQNNIYFAGAWQRYGFHEDGLLSAVRVAEKMGIKPQWL